MRRTGVLIVVALGLALPACGKKADDAPVETANVVRGNVTYKGEPVAYGCVLFFQPEKAFDPKKKSMPAAVAPIKDGKYEGHNLPVGMMMLCVATDPDADLSEFLGDRFGGGPMPGPPGFPGEKGPKGPPGLPPKDAPKPPKDGPAPPHIDPVNPLAATLTAEQKLVLREIHAKYGVVGKSPLAYVVREGEQSFNIDLK